MSMKKELEQLHAENTWLRRELRTSYQRRTGRATPISTTMPNLEKAPMICEYCSVETETVGNHVYQVECTIALQKTVRELKSELLKVAMSHEMGCQCSACKLSVAAKRRAHVA